MKGPVLAFLFLTGITASAACDAQPDSAIADVRAAALTAAMTGAMGTPSGAQTCQMSATSDNYVAPRRLPRVPQVADPASFLKMSKSKLPAPSTRAVAPAAIAGNSDLIGRQTQYLAAWHDIIATVPDLKEQEAKRLALKQSIFASGGAQ